MQIETMRAMRPRHVLAQEGRGWLEQDGDRLVVHTAGTPYEEGFQHGRLLSGHVRAMWEDGYKNGLMRACALFPRWLWTVYARINERFLSADERAELHGVADGAGIAYGKVLVMNSEAPYAVPSAWSGGCTQVVARGGATREGGTIVGRNLDTLNLDRTWRHEVIQVHHPSHGHAWLAPGFAGRVLDAVTGWNDQGLVIAQNDAHNRWPTLFGVSSGTVMRRVVQGASCLREARQILEETPAIAAAGSHVTVVDGHEAGVLEIKRSPGRRALGQRGTGDSGDLPGTLTISNHYTSAALKDEHPSESSASRRSRAQAMVASAWGTIDAERMKGMLTDKLDPVTGRVGGDSDNIVNWHGPRMVRFGPCRIAPDLDVRVTTTLATVADLGHGTLWVGGGKACVDSPDDFQPLDVRDQLDATGPPSMRRP